MTTFSDAQAPTSRTYVPQQGMNIQILTKNHQLNFSHSFFTLEKILGELLPLEWPLVATFSETRALTSRKYVTKQDINVKKKKKNITYFGYTSPFLLKNNSLQNALF